MAWLSYRVTLPSLLTRNATHEHDKQASSLHGAYVHLRANYRGFARRGRPTYVYAHDFAPLLGFLFYVAV